MRQQPFHRLSYLLTVCTLASLLLQHMLLPTELHSQFSTTLGRCDILYLKCSFLKVFPVKKIGIKSLLFLVCFDVCRACPTEFVIPASKFRKAIYGTPVSAGMRFGMMFETEESGKRR